MSYQVRRPRKNETRIAMCPHCKIELTRGNALDQTFNIGDEGTISPGGPGRLISVMKCRKCGFTRT